MTLTLTFFKFKNLLVERCYRLTVLLLYLSMVVNGDKFTKTFLICIMVLRCVLCGNGIAHVYTCFLGHVHMDMYILIFLAVYIWTCIATPPLLFFSDEDIVKSHGDISYKHFKDFINYS